MWSIGDSNKKTFHLYITKRKAIKNEGGSALQI